MRTQGPLKGSKKAQNPQILLIPIRASKSFSQKELISSRSTFYIPKVHMKEYLSSSMSNINKSINTK